MQDWILYFNEDNYEFSDLFKKELSSQLKLQLEEKLECKSLLEKYFFNLFVGMIDLELQVRDNYTFANVEIVSPDSFSRRTTIAWKSADDNKVEFFFCDDFPVEELKNYIKPKDKSERKYTFKTYINNSAYPDLSVKFELNKDFEEFEKNEILNLFKSNNIYISDYVNNTLLIDFQSNSESSDDTKDIVERYLNNVLEKLDKSEFKSKIESVKID